KTPSRAVPLKKATSSRQLSCEQRSQFAVKMARTFHSTKTQPSSFVRITNRAELVSSAQLLVSYVTSSSCVSYRWHRRWSNDMAKIEKDDLVHVVSGQDRGKQGKVLRVLPAEQRAVVEGVNRVTKHVRAGQGADGSTEGGLVEQEAALHISSVAVVDPETEKPTRVGYRFEEVEEDGVTKTVKVRFAKASGKEL